MENLEYRASFTPNESVQGALSCALGAEACVAVAATVAMGGSGGRSLSPLSRGDSIPRAASLWDRSLDEALAAPFIFQLAAVPSPFASRLPLSPGPGAGLLRIGPYGCRTEARGGAAAAAAAVDPAGSGRPAGSGSGGARKRSAWAALAASLTPQPRVYVL